MAERDDARLDGLLAAARPAFPLTPDLVPGVLAQLRAKSARRPRRVLRLALVAALALVVLTAGLAAAGAFGVGPLRILFGGSLPSPTVPDTPLGTRLFLGTRVSPEELVAGGDVAVSVPAELGRPDEAYRLPDGIVTLVYASREGLPAMSGSGIGLLLMEIPGDLDPGLIGKVVIESRASLEEVRVAGGTGYWISGAPHLLRYLDRSGDGASVRSRIVGDALVWQVGDVVYRLESALGRDGSVGLAEQLVPLE